MCRFKNHLTLNKRAEMTPTLLIRTSLDATRSSGKERFTGRETSYDSLGVAPKLSQKVFRRSQIFPSKVKIQVCKNFWLPQQNVSG